MKEKRNSIEKGREIQEKKTYSKKKIKLCPQSRIIWGLGG